MSKKINHSATLNALRVKNYRAKRRIKESESDSEIDNKKLNRNPVLSEKCDPNVNFNLNKHHEETSINDEIEYRERLSDSDLSDQNEDINSESSSDEDDYDIDSACNTSDLYINLKKWAIECRITQTSLDSLLKILKPHFSCLPLSSKTLLKTNLELKSKIKKFNPDDSSDHSEYVYFGIGKQLQRSVNIDLHDDSSLHLQFNADGLPLFHSSSKEFWPLLGKIYKINLTYKPFVIAIYYGKGKPYSIQKYLSDFVQELEFLLKNGLTIKGKKFEISVMCFICDRPARAFLKCIKGHNAYYACERCNIKGDYYCRRVTYLSTNCEKRTDESFRNKKNSEHHTGSSPLTLVQPPIDMVQQFVLDFMHLGCLGVMKKLLNDYWLSTSSCKLKKDDVIRISLRLTNLSHQVPSEFQRGTRTLGDIGKWKATEFRFFLLYCGPFVLQNILDDTLYRHFLLLHVACRILSCHELHEYLDNAQIYLERFILLCQQIYGLESQILNVHSLIHLVEDVRYFRCSLSEITAFPFESLLGQLKKHLRQGNKPLIQVCKRMEENLLIYETSVKKISQYEIIKCKKSNYCLSILKVRYKQFEINVKKPNNIILMKDGTVIKLERMQASKLTPAPNEIEMIGKKLNTEAAFLYPVDSMTMKMFKVTSTMSEDIRYFLSDVDAKMMFLEIF